MVAPSPSEVPVVFVVPRSLRALNVLAIAGSLAAFTSASLMGLGALGPNWGVLSGAPTFFVGAAWAALMRWDKRVKAFDVRWGWFASGPLAALNGGLAMGVTNAVTMGGDSSVMLSSFEVYGFIGATFGVFLWAPALVMVLVVFGLPLWQSHQPTRPDRGERTIGIVSATVGAVALVVAGFMRTFALTLETGPVIGNVGRIAFFAFTTCAVVGGGAAAAWANAREARRRRFVARVEAGEEPGYRVESTQEGKVVLRVSSATYRSTEKTVTL